MSENYRNKKIIYHGKVIDDGWNLPREVIEEIEYAIMESREEAIRKVKLEKKRHKGDWLTKEVADEYIAKTWVYRVLSSNQYIDMVRKYGKELQEQYGLTEIEAINILNSNHVEEYINKYQRIRNLIPNYVDEDEICEDIISYYLEGIS